MPVVVEKGEDGYCVVECPLLQGCYTQGKTIDEALRNIREVIDLLLEEEEAQATLEAYRPTEISLHTITLQTQFSVHRLPREEQIPRLAALARNDSVRGIGFPLRFGRRMARNKA